MKYRKKRVGAEPVEIEMVEVEAVRFFSDSKLEAYQWALTINENLELGFTGGKSVVVIPTPEGYMICKDGDYIIKGAQGELYPCKPDIFEQTYERVKEGCCPCCQGGEPIAETEGAAMFTDKRGYFAIYADDIPRTHVIKGRFMYSPSCGRKFETE